MTTYKAINEFILVLQRAFYDVQITGEFDDYNHRVNIQARYKDKRMGFVIELPVDNRNVEIIGMRIYDILLDGDYSCRCIRCNTIKSGFFSPGPCEGINVVRNKTHDHTSELKRSYFSFDTPVTGFHLDLRKSSERPYEERDPFAPCECDKCETLFDAPDPALDERLFAPESDTINPQKALNSLTKDLWDQELLNSFMLTPFPGPLKEESGVARFNRITFGATPGPATMSRVRKTVSGLTPADPADNKVAEYISKIAKHAYGDIDKDFSDALIYGTAFGSFRGGKTTIQEAYEDKAIREGKKVRRSRDWAKMKMEMIKPGSIMMVDPTLCHLGPGITGDTILEGNEEVYRKPILNPIMGHFDGVKIYDEVVEDDDWDDYGRGD